MGREEHPHILLGGLGSSACQLASQQEYWADWPTDFTVGLSLGWGPSWAGPQFRESDS